MSHYNNLKRNALIALLHERGLNAGKRINKAGLIALLEQHDINTVEVPVESEIENDCLVDETDDVSVDSENIRTLQLQVKLEELKLQQLQLKSHNEGVAPFEATGMTQNTNFVSLPTVRSNLPCMQDDCDVLVYFTTLERAFELNSVPKANWSKMLPGLLNAKASKIFMQLSWEVCCDYDETKSHLLEAFKASPDVYRNRLETAFRTGQESYKLFLSRLTEYQNLYLQCSNIDSFEKLKHDNLYHLFVNSLPDDVRQFVRSKQPKKRYGGG